ncbi:MAG TPA: AraC family transcriptional regulator ligand-binding domain-containing protein [Acetobacteraceae bacterium]|nr:AraC family transcriptional regulator ligand-binding domain-containing protein [Acetobacteraceae bacterium]
MVTAFGLAPGKVLCEAGLVADALDDPEGLIPYVALGRLLGACIRQTGLSSFHLRLAQRGGTASLGLVGRFMASAPTLGAALLDIVSNQHRYVRGGLPYLIASEDVVFLGYIIEDPATPFATLIYQTMMAFGTTIVRELAGVSPLELRLAHQPPPEIGTFRQFFDAPVTFDSTQTALVYPRSAMARRLPGTNPALRSQLADEVRSYWALPEPGLLERAERILHARVSYGGCRLEDLAAELGLTKRILNRRLAAEGTTFRQLLGQVRFKAASQLLALTSLSLTEISHAFGYAESSAFTRAFRRWSGLAPSEWRSSTAGDRWCPRHDRRVRTARSFALS